MMRNKKPVDPTSIRLSEHFLLSDFVGCHSVYTKTGHANVFDDPDDSKIDEGVCLAENVFEPIIQESPVSISYGYISQNLAEKIVKYQSASKPSYHQWNAGAAADVIVHRTDEQDVPPIYVARAFDEEFPTSRTITYSESPFICVATRKREVDAGKPRKAFYENRYIGAKKPKYQEVWADREAYFKDVEKSLTHDWRGAGYPTYHGGGVRQVQHIRVGKYCMMSDFLYSTHAVTNGLKNCPTPCDAWIRKFNHVGSIYSAILDATSVNRLSIVRAYESPSWSEDQRYAWADEGFAFEVVPPATTTASHIAEIARSCEFVNAVGCCNQSRRISIAGFWD